MKISELFYSKDYYHSKDRDLTPNNGTPVCEVSKVVVGKDVYEYDPYVEEEEDNRKIFHYINGPDGSQMRMDWSPYDYPSEKEIALWIKLGAPKRIGTGPLNRQDLIALARQKGMPVK